MTHFHRTLVKQSLPRLFSLRHDFSANNTLATLVTFLLSCTLRVRRKFATLAEKIQKYDSTRGNHAIWRFFSSLGFSWANNCRWQETSASHRLLFRRCTPSDRIGSGGGGGGGCMHRRNTSVQTEESVPRKSPGFRIQSEVRTRKHEKEYITLPPGESIQTYPLSIFPTIAHLNLISRTFPLSNFGFFPFVSPFQKEVCTTETEKEGKLFRQVPCKPGQDLPHLRRKMCTLRGLERKATSAAQFSRKLQLKNLVILTT